jgi:putative tryptophan/tyrosine transport system substrate-binding protein
MSLVEIPQCGSLLAHCLCYRFGQRRRLGSTQPRFRTIQVCPKDFAQPSTQVECAMDRLQRGRPVFVLRRREFISLLGGAAAAWPLAARAQQSKVARIGALYIGLADAESFKKELQEGLRELGYMEGQNIAFEFRSAEGKLDRLPELAAELVRLKVDLIVALYVPSALAAKQATREIPIVIVAADPVETGIVASLARPGENITGVSLMSAVLIGKCVELFRDMLAATRQIALLTNAADPLFAKLILDEAERAGSITGIKIQPIMVRGPDEELNAAFAAMKRGQADAVVIQGSLSTKRVADLALEHRLPAASTTRAFVDAGGLMSYGADGPALFRLGAKFVHRVLQGRQPNDLPIEQPTKFELAVNLKTAKAMGLTVPESFLLRADALIE